MSEIQGISIEQIAQIAHEANKSICEATGDPSQVAWADAEQWQRDSAVQGVQEIIDDGSITPERLHDKWREFKAADGWVFGDVKDADAKTHPCMVDYDQLPVEQRAKDHLFGGVVRSLLPFLAK